MLYITLKVKTDHRRFASARSGARGSCVSLLCLMHLLLLVLSTIVALVHACGTASPYQLGRSSQDWIITSGDGRNRTFNIYVPSGYDFNTPLPLMFFFHGGGGTGLLYEVRYGMDDQVEPNKGIVVYGNILWLILENTDIQTAGRIPGTVETAAAPQGYSTSMMSPSRANFLTN